ncbi:Uncharacterized conserved protein, DUF58 family, contains vWF domain [Paenibacillus sp. yr247]|uniref:DUF58 domain-containing protein n=1 Tax=Paenibacillus sp. yr247 TaxID=1761880 RepID=UPI00088EAEBA|nr:DUF58 domain-containing protein [Paenibacillus sp. yr247]SDO90077.1 Uncharacterized conserved protein, DUF58 family, contains vWF domain [Paenibacillus sp. yr247]
MTTSSKRRSALFRFLDKFLFQDFILPTFRFIALVVVGAVVTLIASVFDAVQPVFWSCNGLLIVLSVIDLLLLPKRSSWVIRRKLPQQMDVRSSFEVTLELESKELQSVQVEVTDHLPPPFRMVRNQLSGAFRGTSASFFYTIMALERGKYVFEHVYLRYSGGMGLWKKQVRLEQEDTIEIYPDLSQVRGVLGAVQDALILEGHRLFKKQRSGSEFHYIRDYVQGDDIRHINWKASARTTKLMTNLFQPEKGKIVTLVLDCGRQMAIELEGQVKLDRSLEAALTLAAVALKQGDQVALIAYSNQVKVYVPAGKGLPHLQVLTKAVYDLRTDFVESSTQIAFSHVLRFLKKRSLVVLFSDMESYLYDQEMLPYVQRLRRSHHVLLLSLQDPLIHQWVRIRAEDSQQAYRQSIAHKFTTDRYAYVTKMAGKGIPVMDVPADQLTLSAVNAYLDLKSRDHL